MHNISRWIRRVIRFPHYWFYRYLFGYKIDKTTLVSTSAILDRSNPGGVVIPIPLLLHVLWFYHMTTYVMFAVRL